MIFNLLFNRDNYTMPQLWFVDFLGFLIEEARQAARATYKILIDGTQESDLAKWTDTNGGRITNNQKYGNGYEFDLAMSYDFTKNVAMTVTPFYRFMEIGDSTVATYVQRTDGVTKGWLEPLNKTVESGVKLEVTF
jgi:hypothetical protein